MDTYLEFLVKRANTPKSSFIKFLIFFAAFILSIIAIYAIFLIGSPFFPFLALVGIFWGTRFLINNINVEFEYILTNGEIDVDKIIAKNKRKRLITFKCSDIEILDKYNPNEHKGKVYKTTIDASQSPLSENLWYAVVKHHKLGNTLILFNPPLKMITNMKNYLNKLLQVDIFIKNKDKLPTE